MMDNITYYKVTGFIFLIIFVLHLWRLIQGWEAVIGGTVIPMWVSWLALVVSGLLAWNGLKMATSQ